MRDDERRRTLKIELLSQWKLEAEFRNLQQLTENASRIRFLKSGLGTFATKMTNAMHYAHS